MGLILCMEMNVNDSSLTSSFGQVASPSPFLYVNNQVFLLSLFFCMFRFVSFFLVFLY